MVSTNIRDFGKQLLAQHRISMARIDDAVRRILRVKFRAGLFEHPYVDQAKAADPASFVTADDRAAARKAAGKSMVLLKNDGPTLPLDPTKSTVVIGPLGNDKHDMLGPWWGQGKDDGRGVGVRRHQGAEPDTTTFAQGCTIEDKDPPDNTPEDECGSDAGFAEAVAAAQAADQVVLALGESRGQSGEAAARSEIDLPGKQQELIDAIKATGKPFVVVLFNGRPLTLSKVAASSPAILEAWFPGTEAGNAVADVLFGKVNPGGKLPASFPRALGQIPIYYNHEPTGRPCDVNSKYNSRYRDLAACDALYPFGFGLSYTKFSVDQPAPEHAERLEATARVIASMDVTNTGDPQGRRRGPALHPRPRGEHLAAGPPPARLPARDARPGPEADGQLHPRQERLRLLRQPRAVRRRAGQDRRVRGRQLDRRPEAVVHGGLLNSAGARRTPTPTRAWTPSAIAHPATMSATKCSPP